jgi:chemotaxis family two-component system response regulator Rcp1
MKATRTRPPEILLVDDNPGDARLVAEGFRAAAPAALLSVVPDGVEAIHCLRREGQYLTAPTPDLILLDLRMPRKSGLEVLAEVKQDPNLRSIPVVVLTSSDAPQDIRMAYDLHANCYIAKPIDLAGFLKAIKALSEFWLVVVKLPGSVSHGQRTNQDPGD